MAQQQLGLLLLGAGVLAFVAFGRGGCGMGHGSHDSTGRGEHDQGDRPREAKTPLSAPTPRLRSDEQVPLAPEHAGHESSPTQAKRQRVLLI